MIRRQSPHEIHCTYTPSGAVFTATSGSASWWATSNAVAPTDAPLTAYLDQLLNEGSASAEGASITLPWDAIYALLRDPLHADSLVLLALPKVANWVPRLETIGALSDPDFALSISGWQAPDGRTTHPTRNGATLQDGTSRWLMHEPVWKLVSDVLAFAQRAPAYTYSERLYALGQVRDDAKACGAVLDDYLARTDICTPNTLHLDLQREEALGKLVFELKPQPVGAPDNFLTAFDRYPRVQDRYDLPQSDGSLSHVAPSPAVHAALDSIKQTPGRRLSSAQAAMFVYNPHAVLGDAAAAAIDPEQLAQAQAEAGLVPTHLHFIPEATTPALAAVDLFTNREESAPVRRMLGEAQVSRLCAAAARARVYAFPIFEWEGTEILRDPAGEAAIQALAQWRAQCLAAASAGLASTLLDLAAYSPRVVGFDAKVQAVPYVAHQTHGKGWLPEDDIGIVTVEPATQAVTHHRMTPARVDALQQALDTAHREHATSVRMPDTDTELSIAQAESLLTGLRDIGLSGTHPAKPATATEPPAGQRAGLRIHHNIESLDYIEAVQRLVGAATEDDAQNPASLNPGVQLLPHQRYALAWLQRRYLAHPQGFNGCLLADDMGLGKTLESLALIAWAGERTDHATPSLVVAPVSLLENWKLEVAKFLDWPADSVLSLYSTELASLKIARDQIPAELAATGVRKLLRPGFANGFRLVLTTYETLRDYQLSIAREHWDIVVCDEAQKVKNPAAFVTQAAKALQASFKIACTGTPVENSLADLWCLFDFFQPGHLGALNEFTKVYRASIEARKDGYAELVQRLRTLIEPWVLRRLKSEVHGGLPRKLTGNQADATATALPMSAEQLHEYTKALTLYRQARDQSGPNRSNSMLALLHKLRMICACPMLGLRADCETAPIAEHLRVSPKLAWLVTRLQAIAERGEKAIIFTDYRLVQRILQRTIEAQLKFRPAIVNGATSATTGGEASRQHLIDRFQHTDGFAAIILGTTAVGFGVNIQQANHVIHFTRSWNPAKEDQATDRAYRIGQTRDVYVYCPVVVGRGFESFEQRLDERLEYKRGLSSDMLAGPQEVGIADFEDL